MKFTFVSYFNAEKIMMMYQLPIMSCQGYHTRSIHRTLLGRFKNISKYVQICIKLFLRWKALKGTQQN